MSIYTQHHETRETPAEYRSTNPQICRLCDAEFDGDDESHPLDSTCCENHRKCPVKGCERLMHPRGEGCCETHELESARESLEDHWKSVRGWSYSDPIPIPYIEEELKLLADIRYWESVQ